MNSNDFSIYLTKKIILISDGATGTNLIQRGLKSGLSAENWVLDKPDNIKQLHIDFINAGANIILTSTFGASEIRLKQSGLEGYFIDINQKAVQIAKDAVADKSVLIAGSIGPLGQMLKPLGALEYDEARSQYALQAEILVKSGVDIIVVETQFDLNEAKAAIEGIKSISNIALICSFSFDRGTKTMMGVSPTSFAASMAGLELSALGINCGKSLENNLESLYELSNNTDLPIWFKPNAGLPKITADGNPEYSVSPKEMAENVSTWVKSGASIIGGCCGTSPDHLSAIANSIYPLLK
jgi:5-methyltetrahydrofolate--homocysteine methyltransferase